MLQTPEEYIARLIFVHFQGIADDKQEQELTEWRNLSPRHEEIYIRLSKQEYWENNFRRFIKNEEEHVQNWERLNGRLAGYRRVSRIKKWSYAAVVLLLIGIGSGLFYDPASGVFSGQQGIVTGENLPGAKRHAILTLGDGTEIDLKDEVARMNLSKRQEAPHVGEGALSYRSVTDSVQLSEYHTLQVPRGGEYVLVLADGSEVLLNAESKLTFPVVFREKERRVYLEGEAYFKVKKNPACPFFVEVKPLEVEVTGTTFGIRAYPDETDVLTTLETGTVRVRNGEAEVNLSPDRQAIFDRSTTTLSVGEVDTDLFLAWKDGRIIFDDCPLEKILAEIGRWYDLDIFYAREEVRSYRFSLNIKRHETFGEVLKLLEAAGQFGFEVNGNTIVVR